MEDREEIEIIIKTVEGILQKDIKETDENVYTIDGRQYKAIKNILKENENLKQAIKINQDLYETKCNENKELEEENKRLNNHNIIGRIDAIKIEDLEDVLKPYYIPKVKVEEKIEELDNKRRKFTSDNVNNFYLQEFTRKYTQKSDHDYGVFSTPETITYCTNNELLGRIEVLQDLLGEEK